MLIGYELAGVIHGYTVLPHHYAEYRRPGGLEFFVQLGIPESQSGMTQKYHQEDRASSHGDFK